MIRLMTVEDIRSELAIVFPVSGFGIGCSRSGGLTAYRSRRCESRPIECNCPALPFVANETTEYDSKGVNSMGNCRQCALHAQGKIESLIRRGGIPITTLCAQGTLSTIQTPVQPVRSNVALH